MNEMEFSRMKAAAAEQMRQMNARSRTKTGGKSTFSAPSLTRSGKENGGSKNRETHASPPREAPTTATKPSGSDGLLSGWDIPFLNRLKSEGDLALILGLLLVLLGEKADKKLLFALVYILL